MPLPKDKLAEMVPIEREGSVDEDLLEDSSRRIEEYLRQQGYYKARVDARAPRGQDGDADDRLPHSRQDRLFRVAPGGVEISGNQAIPIEEFEAVHQDAAPGEPFVSAKLDASTGAIKQVYQRRGFANVAVASRRQRGRRGRAQADDRDQGRLARAGRQRRRSRATES